jgi:phosphoenolpyruvate synthase/pyruvate phosphate dikinase
MIPNLKEVVFRDTPFAELMHKRIYNVLLIATKYDAFMLEDDGRVDEQIFNEYNSLGLRYPPRFTQVTSEEEALIELADRHFELVIVMPNMDNRDTFASAKDIKQQYPDITIAVLTPFSKEVTRRMAKEDLSTVDYVFSWLGNADLLLAIIKLIEDKWNAEHDTHEASVQNILLVEDSVRFYSAALPLLYHFVLEQSLEFSKEALNDQLKTMRMRGRPKILLARSYEEAQELLEKFDDNILGVISDMSFMRNGEKDPIAGAHLGEYIKSKDHHIPLILESSEDSNIQYAHKLGASFISKNSKSYPQDLRSEITKHFGFGDFIIIDPNTHQPIHRIKSLHDLQFYIWKIPEESLRYHLSHNHFSRFFFSRAMFPPAVVLKHIDVEEYTNMDEARQLIFDLIVEYRHMKNEGVVAIFQKDRFDEYASFARIGHGSLGGKGRGLAFMSAMVRRYPRLSTQTFTVNIPKTVVVCTDIFDAFMEENELYPIALSNASDEEILATFEQATLPNQVLEDLLSLLNIVHGPIAVRSSSLLEDSHYQPFAGIYSTYMIPHIEDQKEMMRLLRGAIKAVYASVFYRASKNYLTATQNLIDQEKMAIVIQEVVGTKHNNLFYPTMSGVARSLNFYPLGHEQAEDGIANIAFGLGKYIVDGGQTLRFSPKHTNHILQLSTPELALKETQTHFFALDLDNLAPKFSTSDAFNLLSLKVTDARENMSLQQVASTYNFNDHRIIPGVQKAGRLLITFDRLLHYSPFPVAKTIDSLLNIGRNEMGRHVEIEFALDVSNYEIAHFYLLQIRPIVDNREDLGEDIIIKNEDILLIYSENVLGNGIISDIQDIVYVPSANFDAAKNQEIAQQIAEINEQLAADGKEYVLIGPGRWGSSDPWLGIPVQFSHISAARTIVECGLPNYRVDPSQGTHFFQNLTSLGIGYFTITPSTGDGSFDEEWLTQHPASFETPFVRHVHLPAPLIIKMDGHHSKGVILRGQNKPDLLSNISK